MIQKFYSDKLTIAAVGDTVIYFDGNDSFIGRIEEFLPPGDGADTKLANGETVIIGNCKRLASAREVL